MEPGTAAIIGSIVGVVAGAAPLIEVTALASALAGIVWMYNVYIALQLAPMASSELLEYVMHSVQMMGCIGFIIGLAGYVIIQINLGDSGGSGGGFLGD